MKRFLNKVFGGDGDQARTKAGGSTRRKQPTRRPQLRVEALEERTLLSTNLSIGKPVEGSSFWNDPPNGHVFPFKNVTDGRFDDKGSTNDWSYWISGHEPCGNTTPDYFIVDLQGQPTIESFELQNTHNQGYMNGGTKDFRISLSADGVNYHQVVQNQLPQAVDPIPKESFPIPAEHARYVKFEALNCYGRVAGLNEITVYGQPESTPPTVAPAAPNPLQVTPVSSSQIDLSWRASAGATGYSVWQWIESKWQQIAQVGAGQTKYSVPNLMPTTTYYFSVGAFNNVGTNFADYKSGTTLAAPGPLTRATPDPSGTQVDLCWIDVTGEVGFDIYEGSNGDALHLVLHVQANVTCRSVPGLTPGTTYIFVVDAIGSADVYINSAQQTVTTPSKAPPPAPNGFTANWVSCTNRDLSWNDVAGEDSYVVYFQINHGGWQTLSWMTLGANETHLVVGLSPGTTYTFIVGAHNSAGYSWSAAVDVVLPDFC